MVPFLSETVISEMDTQDAVPMDPDTQSRTAIYSTAHFDSATLVIESDQDAVQREQCSAEHVFTTVKTLAPPHLTLTPNVESIRLSHPVPL